MRPLVHFYWGKNQPLSYLRFASVASFLKLNKGWIARVHYPAHPTTDKTWTTGEHDGADYSGHDWFADLETLDRVEMVRHDDLPNVSEVQRSDLLRWRLLSEDAGVWSDIDILYLNSMDMEIFNQADVVLCRRRAGGRLCNTVGFMAANDNGRAFFAEALDFALKSLTSGLNGDYQQFGRRILDALWDGDAVPWQDKGVTVADLPEKELYQFSPKDLWQVHSHTGDWDKTRLGVHWYAGDRLSREAERKIGNNTKLERHIARVLG